MQEIQATAAYVRSEDALRDGLDEGSVLAGLPDDLQPSDAGQRVWELLETPQTIETLCRVLNSEFDLPPSTCAQGVKVVLTHLYRQDLIQLSPDT